MPVGARPGPNGLKAQLSAFTTEVADLRQERKGMMQQLQDLNKEKETIAGRRFSNQVQAKIMQAKITQQEETIRSLQRQLQAGSSSASSSNSTPHTTWQPDSVMEDNKALKSELAAARTTMGTIADLNKKLIGKLDRLQVENLKVGRNDNLFNLCAAKVLPSSS